MDIRVDILDYGRHGVLVKEPRSGLSASGQDKGEALERFRQLFAVYVEQTYLPPDDGPVRSIETITI